MVTFPRPRSESPHTSQRQLLGINLHRGQHHDGFMGDDERMRAQPCGGRGLTAHVCSDPACRASERYRRNTSFRSRRSQLSAAQHQTWERLWPELGYVATPARPRSLGRTAGHRTPGSAATRRWCSRSAVAPALPRWRWRKAEPDVDVVAVEVYRRGLAQLLSRYRPRTASPTSG